ncbi:MAG: hypothetical protein AB1Z38_03160 [Desulfotignum sp.]
MSPARTGHKKLIAIGMIGLAFVSISAYFFLTAETDPASDNTAAPAVEKNETDLPESLKMDSPCVVEKPIARRPVYEYDSHHAQSDSDGVMKHRFRVMGIEKSLDLIVRSDESIKVGDKTISMQDILDKVYTLKHRIHEKRITEFESTEPEQVHNYGIYVVQPGDNIWNVHFNILREYYASRGIHVAYEADEPLDSGYSSGVGKILKFSEIMVIIYNISEEKIVTDLDLIEPLNKLVIYDLDDLVELLSDIDFEKINQIRFDGATLWLPAQEI